MSGLRNLGLPQAMVDYVISDTISITKGVAAVAKVKVVVVVVVVVGVGWVAGGGRGCLATPGHNAVREHLYWKGLHLQTGT